MKIKMISEMVGVSEKCVRTTLKIFLKQAQLRKGQGDHRPRKVFYFENLRRSNLNKGISYSTTMRVLKKKDMTANIAVKISFCQ